MRKIISILLCLVMVLGTAANAFADTSKGSATTLRLEKTEGKVGMTKGDGKAVTIKDGIRLYDGYDLKTDKKSAAYISLDSAKAVMMDASTNVSIKKSGNKLDIMLKSGTILLNVEDKLKGNEELNIRTTNSVTGIRGTIVQASYNPLTQNTEIYLFEGETMGTYLAPDGTWYNQRLTTGSWLASGMGRLEENPQYNGWTVGPNGEWIYTNNKIEGTEFQQWRWSAERGWYTYDTRTSAITKLEAWPFTFKDLQPRVQEWILGDTDMLGRGRQHLDLYPELAENNITATRETAGIVLSQQQEDIEKQDAAIQTAFEEGNGGNTVDNLFKETGSSAPSVPTYAMVYLMDDPATGGTTYTTQYYREGDPVTAPADPVKEGYTFAGWSTALPDAKAKEEETVYAIWSINQYTLSFAPGNGDTIPPINQDYGTAITPPADPEREGYTFKGWNPAIPDTVPADNVTYTAQWGINEYTITFNSNGGSDVDPIVQNYGTTITAPANPTRTGYTFTAWNPAVPNTMPAADMTVNALWNINQYTISFVDSDGVTELADPITEDYGTTITAPADPTKEGYTFTGWDKPVPTTMPAEDTTLTAQWRVNQYTITFDTDGGNTIAPITQNYGTAITAPADPVKTGYTFAGWDVSVPTTMPADNMTITAQWTINQYTISFFDTDGTTKLTDPITQNYGTTVTAPADPTKTGYTFAGWDTTVPTTMPAENLTIKATWTPVTYAVTLNTDGGTINSGNVTEYTYGVGATLPTDVTKANFSFNGWYEPDSPVQITAITPTDIGAKTYIAHWTPVDYRIAYVANEGTINDIGYAEGYTYSVGANLPTNVTRTGHTFGGWFDNPGLTGTAVTAVSETDSGNKTFYAKWTPVTYAVELDPNEGTINTGNITTYTYGVGAALPTDVTLTGNTFGGWYDNEDLTGYEVTAISTTDMGDKTFYAKWTPNTYRVTLNTNGGTVNTNNVTEYTYYDGATLPTATDITKDGYTFAGWYANADFTGDEVFGIEETETGDKTFYAKWIITVRFTLPTGATINSFTVGGSTVTPNGDGSYTVPSGADFAFTFNNTYKVTDASGKIVTSVDGTYTSRTSTSTVLAVEEMPATARNVTVQLMYNPDKVSYTSYSNNVLAVAPSAAAASDTIFTLPEDEVLKFTLSEDESYGVTGAEGATRSATDPNEYSVAAGGSTAILLVNKLSAVSSPNKPITLATGSAAPYKTASDGTLLFTPGSTVILDVSSYSASCQIIVDTVDPAYDTSTGRAPVLSNNQLNTAAGYDYRLIYATNGYSTIDTYGANVNNVEVISTSALFYRYDFNSDLVYMVEPSSEFVFSVDGATVSAGTTTMTTETDGYYHITAGASGTNTSISIQ